MWCRVRGLPEPAAPSARSGIRPNVSLRYLRPAPGARLDAEPGHRPLRGHRLYPAQRPRVPRHRPPDHLGLHRTPRRQPAGHGIGGHRHSRGGAEHRRRASDPDQHERRAVQQHHPGIQPRPQRRKRRPGRPRQGEPGARQVAARSAGTGHRQAGRRRAAVLLAGTFGRELQPARPLRHRRPHRQAAAADHSGRRQFVHRRRAPDLDAHLDLGQGTRRPRPDGAGRRVGGPQPERRNSCRPDRVGQPGIHGPFPRASSRRPQEFGDLVVANQGGQLVRLRDLARVEIGPRDERSMLRFNGTSAVAVGIVRQSKANMVEVADSIRAALPLIEQALPPGVQLRTAFDQSVYVKRSISETIDTLFLAFGLVVIVIFLFLRNMRATIIPGLAIPVSIVGAFGAMFFLGLLGQHLHPAGAHPGHRPGGGRRHHRAGERLPAPGRTRRGPGDRRHARHQRNRLRGHRHDDLPRGGLRPARLPDRHHGPALQRVRRGAGRLGGHLRLRGPDPHPDALRQDPPGAEEPRAGVQGCSSAGSTGWLPPTPRTLGWAVRRRWVIIGGAVGSLAAGVRHLQGAQERVHSGGGPRLLHGRPPPLRRARPSSTPTATRSRSNGDGRCARKSTRTSASSASAATSAAASSSST